MTPTASETCITMSILRGRCRKPRCSRTSERGSVKVLASWLLQEAKALKDGALQRGGSFGAVLADYVRSGGALPSQAAQAMANEAERLLRAADRAAWARPSFRHKALLYVLLAGDRRVAEHLLRVSLCTSSNCCKP